jgi:hypothetical protein
MQTARAYPNNPNILSVARMSPLHHTSLVFSSRIRSSSEPPSPFHKSFSVDRSSTVHTVFTMLQIDGTCESKPVMKSTVSPTDTTQRPRARKRFTSMFSSRKRFDVGMDNGKDAMETKPMRILSPRASDSVPSVTNTPSHSRQHTFSFKKRQSTSKSKIDAPALPKTEELSPELHIPVTDPPCQAPMRKDSVAMPNSPTKEMALHSHPVTKDDDSRASEKFVTPRSGRSAVFEGK